MSAPSSTADDGRAKDQHFAEPVSLVYGSGYVTKIGNCDRTYNGEAI